MKRSLLTLTVACLLAFSCLFSVFAFADAADAGVGTPDDAEQVAAVILHTNDVHVAFQDNIGYDGLALYKKELEEVYDHVLLIDAGDAIQGGPIGAISKGAEIIKMMNRLGYDLAVPGNHEFDYGFEALDTCAEELDCGYTCANFCVTGGEPVFQPWRILEAGDLKIGFVGAVTPDTFTKSKIKDVLNEVGEPMYDFLADETGDRLCAGLQKAIDEVRQAGADYVILVSHLGDSDAVTEQFRTDAVAEKLIGLDMIIDGHSHETFNRTVTCKDHRQIPIAQTGSNMKAIGQIMIYRDGRLEETLIDTVPEPADIAFEEVTRHGVERCVDPEMKAFLDEIVASYAPVMDRIVGEVSYDMIVDGDGIDNWVEENGLCDFVTDAYRTVGGTQIALINAASVRNDLEAGTITYNDVLNILPYSNDIVTVSLSGQMLLDALEFGVSRLPAGFGGFPQVSGITFRVNSDLESSVVVDEKGQFVSVAGEYRVSDVMVGQEPLDPKAEYTLTSSSFMLGGGDGYTMFKEADVLTMTMLPDNEVVINYLEEYLDGVIPEDYREPQGRILMTPSDVNRTEKTEDTDDSACTLDRVVILSRHNIRSPLSEGGSLLGDITPHEWFAWTSRPGELSLRGALLETMMGQYFRLWLEDEGFFPENYRPEEGAVRFYANAKQRTLATARYFSAGLLPVANVEIESHAAYDTMDPTFIRPTSFLTDEYAADISRQVAEMGGEDGMKGILDGLHDAMELLMEVADIRESKAYKDGTVGALTEGETTLLLEGLDMEGPINTANSVVDALTLQYYEEADPVKAAFGHALSREDWLKLHSIADTFSDMLFTRPLVCVNMAHPLLQEIRAELQADERRFSFLCGHDCNIVSVLASLGVTDYRLPETIEPKTPIGCKLVFERWLDAEGEAFYKVSIVYQSTEQLREYARLSLDNPPMKVPVVFPGVQTNADGMIAEDDLLTLFDGAIDAYERLRERYTPQEELLPAA